MIHSAKSFMGAFCMHQVLFAFEFESEWSNGNSATKHSLNYHFVNFGKVGQMAKCHSVI